MRLVIHAGLHKTASTYLQHVLVLNRQALRARNVYFEPDAHMLANHGTAWMTLLDNVEHVAAHIRLAARAGYDAAILSSEDFETLIFDHERARSVVQAARQAGAVEIEWHFCLRDPGDYFASLYAQLSKLAFVEYGAAFVAALRDGRVRVFRQQRRYPLYWDFCLDYETHLAAFANAVACPVHLHDFRDATPFPGHAAVAALAPGLTLALPGESSRNRRVAADAAEAGYADALAAILGPADLGDRVAGWFRARLHIPEDVDARCREALSRKYAPGMERLLQASPLGA
ncbi:MAG TPA: hypothetical protein VHA07_14400 [Devosia sp.]|nr:hypothetical protein [Devosia sp.]